MCLCVGIAAGTAITPRIQRPGIIHDTYAADALKHERHEQIHRDDFDRSGLRALLKAVKFYALFAHGRETFDRRPGRDERSNDREI